MRRDITSQTPSDFDKPYISPGTPDMRVTQALGQKCAECAQAGANAFTGLCSSCTVKKGGKTFRGNRGSW